MVRWAADSDVFHAVADPTRRKMLDLLAEQDRPVTDLVNRFDISQPSISQHLRVLRDAGLVTVQKAGRLRIYSLNPEPIRKVFDWAAFFERFWNERLDNLDRYLAARHAAGRRKPDAQNPAP